MGNPFTFGKYFVACIGCTHCEPQVTHKIAGVLTGPLGNIPGTVSERYQARSSISYVTKNHNFKVGTDLTWERQDSTNPVEYPSGSYTLFFNRGVPNEIRTYNMPVEPIDRLFSQAAYATDTWTRGRVTFAYGGGPPDTDGVEHPLGPEVLRDASIAVAPGERVALVGPTGAGKSTLAKLMARFYDPRAGTVRYGDVDLRAATFASLRRHIVVVPQEGFLFAGTIRDNVRVGRDGATDAEVDAAVAALGLTDTFGAFPEGMDTEVRERGSRLSAGERQLVSLARAALVDPAVLVLDEATSNLDPGTEVIVERALDRLMTGRTTIVVAHRLSTIRRADRIAVVDHGRLAELGTHDELVALGGRYAALSSAWERSQPST